MVTLSPYPQLPSMVESTAKKTTEKVPVKLKECYIKAGQAHIFKWIDELDTEQLAKFLKQLESIDIEQVMIDFKKAKESATEMTGRVQPSPLKTEDMIMGSCEEFRDAGLKAIKEGTVAVLTLAGGQGTRLGSSDPKGCYNIGLPSGMSLFELQATRLKSLLKLAKADKLPWYIMTSEATHKKTIEFFKKHDYFGLPMDTIKFFNQGELPAIDDDGRLLMKEKWSLAMSPNGNGGIYSALKKEEILKDFKKKGIKYVHMYCVDNALVKIGDPNFIGGCILKGADCAAKTIKKVEANESVGVFCRRQDGKLMVAEYSELDSNVAGQTDRDGNLLLNQANIANHFFTLPFLEKCAKYNLPVHLARKAIPSIDEQGKNLKTAPMGFKLECFIFDVFEMGEKPLVYQGKREEEFAPLKNAPGSERDGPEQSRRMLLELHGSWLKAAGAIVEGKVEISPLISYGGEGLGAWKDKKVTGLLK